MSKKWATRVTEEFSHLNDHEIPRVQPRLGCPQTAEWQTSQLILTIDPYYAHEDENGNRHHADIDVQSLTKMAHHRVFQLPHRIKMIAGHTQS